MRRSVIEKMIRAYPELLQPLGPVGPAKEEFPLVPHLFHYLDPNTPEDISFCRRWRAIGGKIHALLDCETVHYGVDAHPMNAMKWLMHEAGSSRASVFVPPDIARAST